MIINTQNYENAPAGLTPFIARMADETGDAERGPSWCYTDFLVYAGTESDAETEARAYYSLCYEGYKPDEVIVWPASSEDVTEWIRQHITDTEPAELPW